MTESTLYWITRLDSINNALVCFIILSFVVAAVLLIVGIFYESKNEDYDEDIKIRKRMRIKSYISFIIFMFLMISNVLLPTTKEMATIIVIPAVVNSKIAQKVPDYINELVASWIEELKPQNHTAPSGLAIEK